MGRHKAWNQCFQVRRHRRTVGNSVLHDYHRSSVKSKTYSDSILSQGLCRINSGARHASCHFRSCDGMDSSMLLRFYFMECDSSLRVGGFSDRAAGNRFWPRVDERPTSVVVPMAAGMYIRESLT